MSTNTNPLFDRLEPRQHMAVDLTAGTVVPKGNYGNGDLFDINIKLRNLGSSSTSLPNFVNVVLSKDKVLGNADDITFAGTVFLNSKAGKTVVNTEQVHVQSTWKAGDYYVITQTDPYNSEFESNEKNNVSVSATPEIRIVTDTLADGAIVSGTGRADTIAVQGNFANDVVTVNGKSYLYSIAGNLKPLSVRGGRGDDKITFDAGCNGRYLISGNSGNDTIIGSEGDDTITGDAGADRIYGNGGADVVNGGSSNDFIDGGTGIDHISGDGGKDKAKKDASDVFAGIEQMF